MKDKTSYATSIEHRPKSETASDEIRPTCLLFRRTRARSHPHDRRLWGSRLRLRLKEFGRARGRLEDRLRLRELFIDGVRVGEIDVELCLVGLFRNG